MGASFTQFILFVMMTFIFFTYPSVGRQPVTLDILKDAEKKVLHDRQRWVKLLLYYVAVMVSQFILNSVYMSNKCAGSAGENVWYAMTVTIAPWTLVFAITLIVVGWAPDMKSAFSDVFGYFMVSGRANEVFSKMLVSDAVAESPSPQPQPQPQTSQPSGALTGGSTGGPIEPSGAPALPLSVPTSPPPAPTGGSEGRQTREIEETASAVVKIMGDKSVIVNQFTTQNFLAMWAMLRPLMRPQAVDTFEKEHELQTELLDVVQTKDVVGEIMWYIYAGVLAMSIVSYNLSVKECTPSLAAMRENEKKYASHREEAERKKTANQAQPAVLGA
jgi:hypothetical protein